MTSRQFLTKLMKLNNEKADQALQKLADKIAETVATTNNYSEISDALNLLQEFVYRVPESTIEIVQSTLIHKIKQQNLKEASTLITIICSLLKEIRYIAPRDVFESAIMIDELAKNKEDHENVHGLIRNLCEYNLTALGVKQIGLKTQDTVIKAIKEWEQKKKVDHLDIIVACTKEFLSPSAEGQEMTSENTVTWTFRSLKAVKELKTIRRESIDLLLELLKTNIDLRKKISIINTLGLAMDLPVRGNYEDDLEKMVLADTKYILRNYKGLMFERTKLTLPAPLVEEILEKAGFLKRRNGENLKQVNDILSRVRKNHFYYLYHLLTAGIFEYEPDQKDWKAAEKRRKDEITKLMATITTKEADLWSEDLNQINSYIQEGLVSDQSTFYSFLATLAEERPEEADQVLSFAFHNNLELIYASGFFLRGFYVSSKEPFLKYLEKIVSSENQRAALTVCTAYRLLGEDNIPVDKKDLQPFIHLINQSDRFTYLKSLPQNIELEIASIASLRAVSKYLPKAVMNAILEKKYKSADTDLARAFNQEVVIGIYRQQIKTVDWSNKLVQTVLEHMIQIPHLGHEDQDLMFSLAKDHFASVMNVFIKRIKHSAKMRGTNTAEIVKYDAVPYYLDEDLRKEIIGHKDYIRTVSQWIEQMTVKWSPYNFELAEFLSRTITHKETLIQNLIATGDDKNLQKAVQLLGLVERPNIKLCLAIVSKTDSKKIWHEVEVKLYSTGVVSGEYGISNAHKQVVKSLKQQAIKTKSKRVKKFIDQAVQHLNSSIKKEEQRVKEELKIRQIEFEG